MVDKLRAPLFTISTEILNTSGLKHPDKYQINMLDFFLGGGTHLKPLKNSLQTESNFSLLSHW